MGAHEKLLDDYATELGIARDAAEKWWKALVDQETQRLGSADAALTDLRARWRDGPASHPRVLGVIRKYWLLCEALNQQLAGVDEAPEDEEEHDFDPDLVASEDDSSLEESDEDEAEEDDEEESDDDEEDDDEEPELEVYPHVFIHEWLLDDHEDLFQFLGRLTYWPVGLDDNEDFT